MKFNTKIKIYPDGNYKATYCNAMIFNSQSPQPKTVKKKEPKELAVDENGNTVLVTDFEVFQYEHKLELKAQREEKRKANPTDVNVNRAVRRAKERLFDIIYLNDFKYFATITIDPKQINSRNAKEVISKLLVWLNHQQQRLGMEYVLVPEYHVNSVDGATDRIHCHMLITDYPQHLLTHAIKHSKGGGVRFNSNGSPMFMYDSHGQPIYNMLGWKYGFSTCIPVYNSSHSNLKLAHYVTKYVTKDVHQIFGKYYWSSKGLCREVYTEYMNSDYYSIQLKEYEVPNTKIKLKYESQFNFDV